MFTNTSRHVFRIFATFKFLGGICNLHVAQCTGTQIPEDRSHMGYGLTDTESGIWTFVFVANAIRDIPVSMET